MKSLMLIAAVLLAGCQTITPVQQRAFDASVPTCAAEKECELKWAAARRWVLDNAGFKMKLYTADFMETYNSARDEETAMWATVTRDPLQDGSYRIVVEVGCNNMFGCTPPAIERMLAFNAYVSAAWKP